MPKRLLKTLRNSLPWLVAGGIFFYLFRKTPPGQVWEVFHYINLPIFFGFAIIYFLVLLALDVWGLSRILTRYAVPVSFSQLLPGRLVSYLLAILNYNAGQAALAAFLKKTRHASFFKSLGAIFFLSVIDLYLIIALAFIGSFFFTKNVAGFELSLWVRRVGLISIVALILHLAFWRGWFAKIFPKRMHFGLGDWLRGKHLFQAFHHATVADYVKYALYRLPIHLFIIVSYWLVLRIFQAEIAFTQIIAILPVVFMLGAIPATPGGLGAVQVASVELLKDQITLRPTVAGHLAPADLLFAMSLSWMFTNYLIKAILGCIVLMKNSKSLFKSSAETDSTPPSP